MKKKVVTILLALTAVLVLGGCAKKESQPANKKIDINDEEAWKKEPAYKETIKVGYNGGACLSPLGLAKEKGFYEKEGLNVELVSTTETKDAVGTGQVDFSGDHIATLLVPAVNGVNMLFTTGIHTGCKTLYVLSDSGITSTKDLIGQTIAVPDGIGNSDHNIALRFLNKDNIAPDEVHFKQVESTATILAMESGEIQGAVLSDQFAKKFLDEGKLTAIRSITFDDDFKTETCCVLAMNRDFYEKNPITAAKITRAMKETREWVENNKEEAVDLMLENNWASGDRQVVLDVVKTYNFGISDADTEKTLKDVMTDYKKFGIIGEDKETEKSIGYLWNPVN